MIWGIVFDVILWIATAILFTVGITTGNIMLILLGWLCLLLAIVLLCILTGWGEKASSLVDDAFDILD
jgi:hypothetical protein